MKSPHVGADVMAHLHQRELRDPEFAAISQEEYDKLELARQIRQLREARGLSQAELAELLGTRQPSIARIESGRVLPRIDMLFRLATALGLRLRLDFHTPDRERTRK